MARTPKKLNSRPANRGPAAARENREALLAAAREVFSTQGYRAPFSAISKAAGVGQAVLYRHFPNRLALALAVFEDNLHAYEQLVASPDGSTLQRLWERVCDDLIDSVVFVEMSLEVRRTSPATHEQERWLAIVEVAVEAAVAAGTVPRDFTADAFHLGVRMAYGVVVTSPDDERKVLRKLARGALPQLQR